MICNHTNTELLIFPSALLTERLKLLAGVAKEELGAPGVRYRLELIRPASPKRFLSGCGAHTLQKFCTNMCCRPQLKMHGLVLYPFCKLI